MTRSDLITKLAQRHALLTEQDAEMVVKAILNSMMKYLSEGDRIEIRGFGSFCINSRSPRVGRNPKSGEIVLVPAKRATHFKAAKELRDRVNRNTSSAGSDQPD